jgi:Transglutaminase-like superfamily
MGFLRKILLLPTADMWLLLKTALLLVATKLGMQLLPFRTLRRLLALAASVTAKKLRDSERLSTDRITWAVEATSRRMPWVRSCLTQALATQVLLIRHGYPALLHIGVIRGELGQFRAHAWVESEGKVLIGGSGSEGFTPLAILEGEGS